MLRKEAVSADLLETLNSLMGINSLNNFRLVGGTALALQIGHRISVDIDLFSDEKNDYEVLLTELKQYFGSKVIQGRNINSPMGKGVSLFINDIKTDIIDWNTNFIRPVLTDENIRLSSKEDIIPMKFNTFMCAPEFARYEKKDYTDIAFLIKEYSIKTMIDLYQEKYLPNLMTDRMMIEGLQLHEMADKKAMPQMLNGGTWNDIKNMIDTAVSLFNESRIDKQGRK
jgi:hypothetical protein